MPIHVSDLPPKYQAQVLKKLIGQGTPSHPDSPPGQQAKPSKYHNTPTVRVTASGRTLRFDSRKEAQRFDELLALEQAGTIRDLRLQVDFTLQEAYTDTMGQRVRAIRYRADFTYYRRAGNSFSQPEWVLVVEDVKSKATRTKEYALKKKLLKERLGIDITEEG